MLTEQFIASVGIPTKPTGNHISKDAAIFIHEFQPLLAQRTVLKKCATSPNCLAVNASHIFAAQAEKAVVHVYSREKGNQEATVPFTERITCITLACDDTVLVLGTAEGRIFLWEIASGRQVSTAQAHLQAVTVLDVDPTGNFLLSASNDSTVHVWSIPSLLSFTNSGIQLPSPLQTFTSHRSEVTALVLGHSSSFSNIAVSASKDRTCFIWDYQTNSVLRTYLLPAVPTCLSLDVADRAVYVGYDNGCIQQLDLYDFASSGAGNLHNAQEVSAPIQPPQSSKWRPSDSLAGAALCMSVSFDSSTILSGHDCGALLAWDVGKSGLSSSLLQNPLPGPVTTLFFLPVTGFSNQDQSRLRIPVVIKPKFGAFDSSSGTVPGNYFLNVELPSTTCDKTGSEFEQALTAPSFPTPMLDEGLNELLTWKTGGSASHATAQQEGEDFMALGDQPEIPRQLTLEEQNAALKAELEALRRLQSASFDKTEKMSAEMTALLHREQKRLNRRDVNGVNGTSADEDLNMDNSSSSED